MFVNLTPHTINLIDGEATTTIPRSGSIARVAMLKTEAGRVNGIPTFRTEYGEVEGLPEPGEGVFYIVSGLVAARANRPDVLSPGALVRDEEGRPVGCAGLTRWG